ncbi:MAG: GAF domain-containing sensor histidine kinase [Anaerolineae bacterium]|nr:GAF domain-containing sensor histidine kinase [Anaerolineae bacterium]
MAETRELSPLLNYAMAIALDLFKAERGYLFLQQADGTLEFKVKIDRMGHEIPHPEEAISHTVYEKVIQTSQPFLSVDALTDPSLQDSASVQALQLRSVMCAPLITRSGILGALYVENRSQVAAFHDSDLQTLTFFASQAAVAIENAILNDTLEARVAARTAELQRAMEQLERSWIDAVDFNRMRTLVLSSVAHDIRSPIALAHSVLETIVSGVLGPLEDKQSEWIERAIHSLKLALELTSDIFDLVKSELGALRLAFKEVNLYDYLKHLFSIAQTMPMQPGVELRFQADDNLPAIVIDPVRIQQVVLNLLSNAQKYTSVGSITLYAQVYDERYALVGVRDTGMGIEPEQQMSIFDRFIQGSQDEATQRRGTGLGLAVSKELVERHGGQIWVESAPGQGSDFRFLLPWRSHEACVTTDAS